jgi:type IV pilus assembly protein PilQ
MKPLRQLAATVVALGAIGGSAALASALPFNTECSELGAGSCVTFRARPMPAEGLVTSLSIVPTSGRADVVVGVEGNVSLKHFTLKNPTRIVVDISGATLGLRHGESYDGVPRGGITRVAYSQFSKNVVRVVLTLAGERAYDVAHEATGLRISLQGSGENFERWQLGAVPAAPQQAPAQPAAAAQSTAAAPAPAPAASTPAPAQVEQAPTVAPVQAEQPRPVAEQVLKRVSNERSAKAQQQSQQPRITITWENASITDVLASLAATFHRTILSSRNVTGTISASIIDQPWDVALKAIMNANGFDVTEDPNGIIYVDTFEAIAERQATTPLGTRTVRLNYAKAATIAPMIAQRLSRACPTTVGSAAAAAAQPAAPGAPAPVPVAMPAIPQTANCPVRGAVSADSITNSVSITDVPQVVGELEAYAKSLDLRQPQVNIKAKIILVDRTSLEGLGLRYDLGTQRQFFNEIIPRVDSLGQQTAVSRAAQILLGGNTVSAIANATQRVPAAALQLVYSTALGNYDVSTFLEAMQGVSLLDVQAEPSASVLNNRTANLTAGTQVPVRDIDAAAGANAQGSFPRATVQFQQTGVILTVTPQITNNRQIQMKVHVENSDVQFEANDVGAVFPKQSVDNEVLVADGETAVMGGLTQTTLRYTKTGIPFLVDLPVIGRLFGVTNRQETKRDLLILITPHIIDDGQSPESGRP